MACQENMFFIGLCISSVNFGLSSNSLFTKMPETMNVVSDTCVQIPCAFQIPVGCNISFSSAKSIYGIWLKGTIDVANVIFNSSNKGNRYQGNITGNLSQKNCTTVFFNVTTSYTNKYYFRIDTNGQYRATDIEKSVQINVQDSPQKPHMTVLGDIKEENPVSLNCSAVAPCPEHPPKLIWTLPTKSTPANQMQENPDQTKSVISTVTFNPSYLHNDKNITCTAVYPVGTSFKTAEHTRTVHVLFSPKGTSASISPADPVSVGSCVNLTCSSIANPPVTNFTWFRISGGKTTQVASRQNYTLNVTVGDGGQYYCEARNCQGLGKSPKVELSLEGPSNQMVFGVVGGTLLLVLLIMMISFLGWRRKSRLSDGLERTDNPPEQDSPVYANQGHVNQMYANRAYAIEATSGENAVKQAKDLPDPLQYAEIDFSKQRPKETPAAGQDRETDQRTESEYSEVRDSGSRTTS